MVERPLSVTDFKRKDGIVKHVQYAIQGTDPSGPINITRRYKDFTYLRKLLVSNWPGCFVPQIPPKQMIVNSN